MAQVFSGSRFWVLDLMLFGETGNYGAKSHASSPHYVGIHVFFFTLIVYLHVNMGLFDCVKLTLPNNRVIVILVLLVLRSSYLHTQLALVIIGNIL